MEDPRDKGKEGEGGGHGVTQADEEDHANLASRYPVGTEVYVYARPTADDEAIKAPLEEKEYFTSNGALKQEVPLLAGKVTVCDLRQSVEHWTVSDELKLPPPLPGSGGEFCCTFCL